MIFFWQTREWQQLMQAHAAVRLPHALLFAGIEGLGKVHFADIFSRALLCQARKNVNDMPCEICHACQMHLAKTHPNLLWIQSEKAGQAIKIDQIRAANEFVQQSSLQGQYRLVMIQSAENMNLNAANALLKTLEEPASHALIILISDHYEQLPQTILSRCQRIVFQKPPMNEAINWLAKSDAATDKNYALLLNLSAGSPLKARRLIDDNLLKQRDEFYQLLFKIKQNNLRSSDNDFSTAEALTLLDWLVSFVTDLLRFQLNIDSIINVDYHAQLKDLAATMNVLQLQTLIDELMQLRAQLLYLNLNKQLIIEEMLARFKMLTLKENYVFN